MLFSIIVPIYKVEAYLERCLLSIVEQKEGVWEAILVNDGSPDRSGAIADRFAQKYKDITVIHKTNGGLSDARNVGLASAQGEYILFVDSDDALLPGALEKLEHAITEYRPQVAFINTLWINNIGNAVSRGKKGIEPYVCCSGTEALKKEFSTGSFFAMAQGCVCDRAFLLRNSMLFKKGIIHEDEHWTPRMMLSADKVVYFPLDIYEYMLRDNSITTSGDKPKNGEDIANTSEELYEIYSKIHDRTLRTAALRYNAKLYLKGLSILVRCKKKRKPKMQVLLGKWASIRSILQGGIFIIFPHIYANIIDYRLMRGRKNDTN